MMTIAAFLTGSTLLLVFMVVLAVIETIVPFSKKDWRGRHVIPNLVLTSITLCLNFAFNAGAILITEALTARHFGLLSATALSPLAGVAVSVVVLDASTYVCHRLMHVIPALWRAHSVHHADPLVDVTTSLRFHPVEAVWRFAFIVGPAWLLGLPAAGFAVYRVASALVAPYEHMNVRLWQPIDTALSFLIGTPNMHKIHHSRVESETNTNYGNIFSIFDRVLGTFTPSARAEFVDTGLERHDDVETQRLLGLLRLPFDGHAQSRTGTSTPRLAADANP
jgi:sterol desaturase/sphingolipid hydroxylase (fatty acid hydroxylase superfamily)